jgi:hypothetical protein
VAHQCSSCLAGQDIDAPRGVQNPDHPGFVEASARYDCQACINWHAREFKFPTLGAANQPAWALYLEIQGQQRGGGFGPMGLDVTVLPTIFDLHQIPQAERLGLYQKLLVIDRVVQEHEAGKREKERRSREAKKRVDV